MPLYRVAQFESLHRLANIIRRDELNLTCLPYRWDSKSSIISYGGENADNMMKTIVEHLESNDPDHHKWDYEIFDGTVTIFWILER